LQGHFTGEKRHKPAQGINLWLNIIKL